MNHDLATSLNKSFTVDCAFTVEGIHWEPQHLYRTITQSFSNLGSASEIPVP